MSHMDEQSSEEKFKVIEQWADKVRAVMQEAKDAGMVFAAYSAQDPTSWDEGGFAIEISDRAPEADGIRVSFHVWSDDDQRPVNS